MGNGREAIGFLSQANDIDLVVSDISMPEMDGLALADQLAELRAGLPVVLISGNQVPRSGAELERPHRAFLTKPATIDALRRAIGQARKSPVR